MPTPQLSVIVPMYNEEEVIAVTHERLTKVLESITKDWEIVYVNDGSRDRTMEIVSPWAREDARVRLCDFARNFGHQAAVSCGLEYARGQAIVIIDADLQDPPELIPQMVKHWQEGLDVVYGKRAERKGETAFKKLTASVFYKMMHFMTEGIVPKDTGDFRLIDRKVRDTLVAMPEHSRFLRGMTAWVGFRQMPLEYVREARFAGTTKYPLKKMLKLAADGVFSFSFKPLKLIRSFGLLFVAGAAVWMIIAAILGNTTSFYLQLVPCLTLLCTGLILAAMGLTGEYIGRIFEESKARPNFIVRTGPEENHKGEQARNI